ncbi:MAG: PDZ domain-containing protein [Deltaproteobacteria bacterium]|nr:PDZ domain-containing protein [Deltaproteobacteria bacterium]
MTIETLPPAYAARLGLGPVGAVVIMGVQRGGAADQAGLRPGDVILEADRRPVRGTDDVVAAARDGRAVFLVRRGASQEYVGLAIGNTQ